MAYLSSLGWHLAFMRCANAIMLLVLSHSALATIDFSNDNPTGEGDDELFDYAYGKAPALVESVVVSCTGHGDMDAPSCAAALCSDYFDSVEAGLQSGNKLVDKDTIVDEYELFYSLGCQGREVNEFNVHVTYHGTSGSYSKITTEVQQCPPDGEITYQTEAYVGGTPLCFDPTDLAFRDTCPDTSSSPDFILATDYSGNSLVCHQKEDGSVCPYELSSGGDYYTPSYEANCYDQASTPLYDTTSMSDNPDQDASQDCEDIGNGASVCTEDPDNVCNELICEPGCGYFGLGDQTEFVCVSEDTDGDGVPDYVDPDIDGDGISNDEDLDSDGDGVDDPTYSSGTAISTEYLEALMLRNNEILSAIESNTSDGSSSGGTTDDTDDQVTVDVVEQGSYQSQSDIEADIATAQAELDQLLTDIRDEFQAAFAISVPTAEFFGCYDVVQINGSTHGTCATGFSDELEILGYALLFIFALLSVAIVFR
jgi:hypothetical protein